MTEKKLKAEWESLRVLELAVKRVRGDADAVLRRAAQAEKERDELLTEKKSWVMIGCPRCAEYVRKNDDLTAKIEKAVNEVELVCKSCAEFKRGKCRFKGKGCYWEQMAKRILKALKSEVRK